MALPVFKSSDTSVLHSSSVWHSSGSSNKTPLLASRQVSLTKASHVKQHQLLVWVESNIKNVQLNNKPHTLNWFICDKSYSLPSFLQFSNGLENVGVTSTAVTGSFILFLQTGQATQFCVTGPTPCQKYIYIFNEWNLLQSFIITKPLGKCRVVTCY